MSKLVWTKRLSDRLKDEYLATGEHYQFLIRHTPAGWMAYSKLHENQPFQAFANTHTQEEAEDACEGKQACL